MNRIRAFFAGFIPTLCLCGLAAGLSIVWIRTQSVLTPAEIPVRLEEPAPGEYLLHLFSEEHRFSLPQLPDKLEIFSQYPALLPRGIRLIAWGIEAFPAMLEDPQTFFRENLPLLKGED